MKIVILTAMKPDTNIFAKKSDMMKILTFCVAIMKVQNKV